MTKSVVILLLILLAIALRSSGQSFNLDVIAGANYSTFLPIGGSDTYNQSHKIGYDAGLLANCTKNNLSIQFGAIYQQFQTTEGYADIGPQTASEENLKYTVHYLQVPVNFLYNTPMKFGNIFLGGGPYISFGISGTTTDVGTASADYAPGATNFNTTTPFQFKGYSPDYGLQAMFGVAFKNNFSVILSFADGSLSNSVVGLSLGYAIF